MRTKTHGDQAHSHAMVWDESLYIFLIVTAFV